ncbi:Interferon-induced very large GTPase 1 [Holothuria leucospilota]|uniref:Interferon-induced very large GTPase 1 n=1 Tax=Holothuria leucospilota TaxID=206669 RepID=A0A9Q1C3N1_HOLLE|nr:Interferon-induced very large GTPase 1 [Holothuria leucospilota]
MEGDLKFNGFFPVVLIALSNLALLEKLRELLDINVEQSQHSKRLVHVVFLGIHIFTYSFMGPLAWWTMFVPVFPAVIVAGAVSIYLKKKVDPFTEEDVTTTEDGETFSEFLNTLGLCKSQGMTVMEGCTVKDLLESKKGSFDIINTFLVKISAQDPNAVKELSELFNNRRVVQTRPSSASSRDILFALYTCCDPILLQEVIRKVSLSGNAVPLLLPDCVTDEVTFLLWGLRKTVLSWFDSKTSLVRDINVTNFPIMTMSAIRFGNVSISKTDVLNKLLTLSYGCEERESFLCSSNDPHQTVWSKGTVECDWFISEKMNERNENHAPYALLNLRGDGRLHKKQVQLCTKVSSIVIIFANSVTENELKPITENVNHVVLVNCSSNATSIQPTPKLSIVQYSNVDTLNLCKTILEIVKEKEGGGGVTLEGCKQLCGDLDIRVDEQSSDHNIAKSHASETIEAFTLEEESSKEIQEFPGTSLKILSAKTFTSEQQKLYFAWLQMLLHNRNATALAPALEELVLITQKRREMFKQIPFSTEYESNSDTEQQIAVQTEAMKTCMEKCEMLSLHPLIRKLGDHKENKQKSIDAPADSLPQIIANALLNGVPLQIADVKNNQSSIEWLGEVFESLKKLCNTRHTVRVISVLGGTSTHKSTLLNSLFGTDFQVGVGKCSEGVVMQLVPVHNSVKQFLGCDFLVIIDAQGLNIAESKFLNLFDQNNQIVSTCCCVSDIVIVNTNSTTPQQDANHIFEIVVDGLITAAETNGLPKCCLVQHIDRKTAKGLDKEKRIDSLFEQLKLMVQETTKVEEKDHLGQEILNVFCSDDVMNIAFIPHREASHGVKPSEDYSTNILNLRRHLLQIVAKHGQSALTFLEIYQRIVLVTKRSFQSTDIKSIESALTEQYRKRLLAVQQKLMEELTIACNGIKNSPYESLDHKVQESEKNMTCITERKYEDLQVKVKHLFQSRKHKPLKEQLHYFEKDLITSKESFLQVAVNYLQKTVQRAKQYQERDFKVRSEWEQFFQGVGKLILDTKVPHAEKKETVTTSLNHHVAELIKKYPPPDKVEVQRDVTSTMENKLRECTNEAKHLVGENPISKFSMNFHQASTKTDIYVSKSKFNVVKDSHEKMLLEFTSDLKALSDNHPHFEQNSTHVTEIIKKFEEKIHPEVEDITVYLFLSSKFVCGVHNSQMRQESQLLDKVKNDSSSENESEVTDFHRNNNEIKYTEPITFATLTSKIEHFLTHWKKIISEEKFEILKGVMTVKNVQNCGRLPSTFLTLQRLDRCFIDMLPELSSDDITTINDAVNDAKLIVLSKTLAKACLDLEDIFQQIVGTIKSSVLVGSDKDEIKAAALVHVSAWSVGAFSIKSYEDQRENNPANAFVGIRMVFEATFNATMNENCYEEIADIVCGDIHNALIEIIQSELINHLRASFLSHHDLFNVKKAFIGTVLRDLCQQDDYNGFVNFLKNYDEFSQKWILKFLAKECNKEKDSLLQKIVQELIRNKLSAVISALKETLSGFQNLEKKVFSLWLSLLHQKLLIYSTTLNQGEYFDALKDNIKVTNFQAFTNKLISKVNKLNFQESLHLPEEGNEDDTKTWLLSEGGELHMELSKLIKGCIHQCPFCGAACENTLEEHDFHRTALHYPPGINGWRYLKTKKLIPEICTANVASNRTYKTPLDTFRPYKEYKEDYPDWDIPAEDDQPMEFWKFIFSKFNKKFAILHNCLEGDAPEEWLSYSKEAAINSVELAYHIPPI